MNAMFPPAVTTSAFSSLKAIPFSLASLLAIASCNRVSPTTGLYLLFSGSFRNSAIFASALGGGPYDTTPCPREIVPGQLRIHSATTGIIGVCTAVMRADSRMGNRRVEQFARAHKRMVEIGAKVLQAQTIDEPAPLHGEQRLRVQPADHKVPAMPAQLRVDFLQHVDARRIDRQQTVHA